LTVDASSRGPGAWRRVLLVGFMGAGKSSVGNRLAHRMGWSFVDADDVIEAEAGRSIPEIFAASGEGHFRGLEAGVVDRLLRRDRIVIATGGGWAAAEGRLESVPPGTATVWLRVGGEEAVRRTKPAAGTRPMLVSEDPVQAARALLAARAPFYALARWTVDTERSTVEDVTARILDFLSARPPQLKD
jgi:shikimate kinase